MHFIYQMKTDRKRRILAANRQDFTYFPESVDAIIFSVLQWSFKASPWSEFWEMMPIYDSTSDPCAQESSLSILKDLNSLTSLNRKLQKLWTLCCELSRDEFPKGVFMAVVCFCFLTNNDRKGQEERFSFSSETFNFHIFSFEYFGLAIATSKTFSMPWCPRIKTSLSIIHSYSKHLSRATCMGFPGSSVGKESACSAGDLGSILGSERTPGEGNGNPLQYSCLVEELVGYSPWGRKSQTRLSD